MRSRTGLLKKAGLVLGAGSLLAMVPTALAGAQASDPTFDGSFIPQNTDLGISLNIFFVLIGAALVVFMQLSHRVDQLLRLPLVVPAHGDITLQWDEDGSPWHTRCHARGADRLGALAAITGAFAVARVSVHGATIAGDGREFDDVFELTDSRHQKLDAKARIAVERALRTGGVRGARGPRVQRSARLRVS